MRMDDVNENELVNNVNSKKSVELSDEELIAMTRRSMNKAPLPIQNQQSFNSTVSDMTNYWEIKDLPSKGRLYPEGTVILGRPLKVIEIKKITSMNESNGDFILNDVLSKCIKGIDVNKLYIADKIYILLWLRSNTFKDSSYVVNFKCNKCEKESVFHFEVDQLEVKQLSDDYNLDNEIRVGNDVIKYEYLTINDELYIDRFKEINSKVVSEVDDELLSMAQMIKEINGKNLGLMEKYFWITNIGPGEFSYLKTYINKNGMGVKPYINVTCKKCGGVSPVGITFREDFFLPEYQTE